MQKINIFKACAMLCAYSMSSPSLITARDRSRTSLSQGPSSIFIDFKTPAEFDQPSLNWS